MNLRRLFYGFTIFAVVTLLVQGGYAVAGGAASPVILEGKFITLWGDGKPGSGESYTGYYLVTVHADTVKLVINQDLLASSGGIVGLNQQDVILQGSWVDAMRVLLVQSIELAIPDSTAPTGVYGSQPWVSILCKFAGNTAEPKGMSYFTGMYSNIYPGLDHFWRQNSYNLVNLLGSGVFGWYTLPHPREYYLPGGSLDWWAAAQDCTGVADSTVNFAPYVGINLMFNADLDCCAWGGTWYHCLDGVCKTWRITWEPPWGYSNIGVIAHETGHGFGLPHSLGNCKLGYDNRWDVLSDVWSNGTDPVYGTVGQHTISFHKGMMGWLSSPQVFRAPVGTYATITLERLALPQTGNFLEAVIPIDGQANHYYTLEVRQPLGDPVNYDKWLPGFAVIIHEVTEGLGEPATLIDQDGNCNTADAGAMFTPGEVFSDALHGITVSIKNSTSTGYVVTINNRYKPVQSVQIAGTAEGTISANIPFTATVFPADATNPITYTWEATGLEPVQHVGGIQDTIDLSWDEVGTKAITISASNHAGPVVDTHLIDITSTGDLYGVELSGPTIGFVEESYTFIAQVDPITITHLITYVWSIDAGELITRTSGISDTLITEWDAPGLHHIVVSASDPTADVHDGWPIRIYMNILLPLSMRD